MVLKKSQGSGFGHWLKTEFIQNNPPKKDDLCCLCDFPIDPRAENAWADHVFRAEHLFLENIYSEKQMRQMGIDILLRN